jgi:glycine/D-amino acid oxidase-like deaminating enzyme
MEVVAVLGAGLQGCCIALELSRRGRQVVLIDQDAVPINRASRRNEGKIHLGLLWANDGSFESARLQLEGALNFHRLLTRWIGSAALDLRHSTPFTYLVARDSLIGPGDLSKHYARVEEHYRRRIAENGDLSYMGRRPRRLYRRLSPARLAAHFNIERVLCGFETVELSIDTEQLARAVRTVIAASPRIQFCAERRVREVQRISGGFQISGTSPGGNWSVTSERVVNATWESRIAIDRTVGISGAHGWVHRLKYRVIARLPRSLRTGPSATIVLGPYGDVVIRPDGTAYLSWYPLGMRGWTHDVQPPTSWDAACRGDVKIDDERDFIAGVLEALDAWYPGVAQAEPILTDAGVIVAHGTTDVGDVSSGLHNRTTVGVTSIDGYHSVDPGKLTTAPLFGMFAVDTIVGSRATDLDTGSRPTDPNDEARPAALAT